MKTLNNSYRIVMVTNTQITDLIDLVLSLSLILFVADDVKELHFGGFLKKKNVSNTKIGRNMVNTI